MTCRKTRRTWVMLLSAGLAWAAPLAALESDRQQPLEVNADATDGSLGDGVTVLSGRVEIRQGSLHIRADRAEIAKQGGRVSSVVLTGAPAHLEQEIEQQGLVQADAQRIEYTVGDGLVTLTGEADVRHPQYEVTGEVLVYDLDRQHFRGQGGDGNGRIRIRLDPEVAPDLAPQATVTPAETEPEASDETDAEGG